MKPLTFSVCIKMELISKLQLFWIHLCSKCLNHHILCFGVFNQLKLIILVYIVSTSLHPNFHLWYMHKMNFSYQVFIASFGGVVSYWVDEIFSSESPSLVIIVRGCHFYWGSWWVMLGPRFLPQLAHVISCGWWTHHFYFTVYELPYKQVVAKVMVLHFLKLIP